MEGGLGGGLSSQKRVLGDRGGSGYGEFFYSLALGFVAEEPNYSGTGGEVGPVGMQICSPSIGGGQTIVGVQLL